jgi:plastocyanin
MKFYGLALVAGAVMFGACGGGGEQKEPAADTTTPPPAAPAATPTGTAAPITGTTHEVKMVGDAQGYRYEPANITVKAGDGIKFIMVSGGPHNISFDAATIPDDVEPQLKANMPNSADFMSPMMVNPNEEWTLSLANIKPGKYPFNCTPHLAMGMKGEITVQ